MLSYNFILVVGDKECESGTVNVRSRDTGENQTKMKWEQFVVMVNKIKNAPKYQDIG